MIIFEPMNQLEVETPKGRASVWLVTDYGTETEKVFTCIIKATGEIWEFTNQQIRATKNITFERPLHGENCDPPSDADPLRVPAQDSGKAPARRSSLDAEVPGVPYTGHAGV